MQQCCVVTGGSGVDEFVDTADANTKSTTLEVGAVQKVTYHQNNLQHGISHPKERTMTVDTHVQEINE